MPNKYTDSKGFKKLMAKEKAEHKRHQKELKKLDRQFKAREKRLQGDTEREATSNEVVDLRKENEQLKALVAELSLKNRVLKKSMSGLESGLEER